MSEWTEILIDNFKGESTRPVPERNECDLCQNLDLREIDGEMVVTGKLVQKYAAPTLTDFGTATLLAMDTFHVTQTSTRKEVTVQVQKGTLSKVTGSSPSVSSKNMVAVCVRPYWSGSAWVDSWKWLTRSLLTNLTSKSTYTVTAYGVTKAILDTEPHWIVYNVTQDETANVLTWDASNNIIISRSDWVNGDTVIFMTNYVPWTNLTANYSATADEVSFIKPPNGGIRIAFGGQADRLTLAVKYWKRYGFVSTVAAGAYTTQINNYDELILDPYNIYTDPDPITSNGIGTSASTTLQGWTAGLDSGTNLFWVITAILDDYQEFAIGSGTYTGFSTTEERYITWEPILKRGALNKRFTKIRLYVALSDPVNNSQVATQYRLVSEKEYSAATYTGTATWGLNSTGGLYSPFQLLTYKQIFEQSEQELNSTLGYTVLKGRIGAGTIDTNYVKSWDKAIITGGQVFAFNPVITAREVNIAYRSIVESNGASNYDLIPSELIVNLEGKDGNDVRDVVVTKNNEILVGRDNSCQILDPITGVTYDTPEGLSSVSRRGLVTFFGYTAIPSKYDVLLFNSKDYQDITQFTLREEYRDITDKTLIQSVRDDKANSFCFYDGDTTEFIWTPGKGWVRRSSDVFESEDIIAYSVDEDGQILYQHADGKIYYRSNTLQEDNSISFEWQSVILNVNLMPEIKSTQRFLIGYIAIDYVSPDTAMSMRISLDGAAFGNAITVPANQTSYRQEVTKFIGAVKTLQINLTGTKVASDDDVRIRGIKIGVKPVNFGRWGR